MTRHTLEDFIHPVRLADEVVHILNYTRILRGGYRCDLHFPPAVQFANAPGGFEAVYAGHPQIHPDEVRLPALEYLDRLLAFLRYTRLESGLLQQTLQELPVFRLIVDKVLARYMSFISQT